MGPAELADRLQGVLPDVLVARGEVTVMVSRGGLVAALERLRDEADLGFGFLADVTATDWPGLEPRFWLAYELLSMDHLHRIRVKVGLPGDDPRVPSVTPTYEAANWMEREVFDFFGIVFDGHPDLRRIEMPEDWVGHPLRKDHPLAGVNTQYKGAFIPPPDLRGL
jgi:NADH-quinone oxidoreductase subunit C